MPILILAEHNHKTLHPSTLSAVSAAAQLDTELHIIVAGDNCASIAAQASTIQGITKVLVADDARYHWPLAETIAPLVALVAAGYSHIVATATSQGKDIMPRIAALLDVAQISDIIKIVSPDTFIRPIYAGNALETVQTLDTRALLTIRQTAFAPAPSTGGQAAIEPIQLTEKSGLSEFVSLDTTISARPDLSSARIVIAGGRGIGSKENFGVLESLADKLGAALGASRAAVDAGFVPNDYQIGQTGKVVAPDLYIAIGISGAIQHIAGMKDSKVIVAINKDEHAPIFSIADYGLVADWQTALPEFKTLIG